jgi:pyruvate-formate lyase
MKQTFRGLPASKLTTFDALKKQFLEQIRWLMIWTYDFMLSNYGNLAPVCPSPLLSVFIDGCVDSGLDLTSGGAMFHIMAPLCVGISNTINSLYSIKKLGYDPESAMTTLADLVDCLIND